MESDIRIKIEIALSVSNSNLILISNLASNNFNKVYKITSNAKV